MINLRYSKGLIMKVKTFSSVADCLDFDTGLWDIAFHGESIDSRTEEAIRLIKCRSTKSQLVGYNVEQPSRISLNQENVSPKKLMPLMDRQERIVLEATSLGTVEILFLLKAAKEVNVNKVDILYVEPKEYCKGLNLESSWSREYSLSSSSKLMAVPGFLHRMTDIPQHSRLITFLGYEAARLANAFEQMEEYLSECTKYAIFGVPGYEPGWEMNAMATNVEALERYEFKTVRYCPASSVSGAYDLLCQIHDADRSESPFTIVAPFGTKPHGIATALFLVRYSAYAQSSLIYDHPNRVKGRSAMVRRWHKYSIEL